MNMASWRINPVAMIAAAIALISVFLPWWGLYVLTGVGTLTYARWPLWSPPSAAALRRIGTPISKAPLATLTANTISQNFATSTLVVLVLALVVAGLALAGGLTLLRKYLVIGLGLSIITPVIYAISVAYVTSNWCLLSPVCASGAVGTTTFSGATVTWGFETGFYTFIVGIVVLGLAIMLNNSLARTTPIRRAEVSVPTSTP